MVETFESEALTIKQVVAELGGNNFLVLADLLERNNAAETADLLAGLLPEQRSLIWGLLSDQKKSEIIPCLRAEIRPGLLDEMDNTQLIDAAEAMDVDDLAAVLGDFPEQVADTIIYALEADYRQRLETVLSNEEGTAGRLMRTEVLSVRKDVSLSVVFRWLRRHSRLPVLTDALMVIDSTGGYLGKLELADLVTASPETLVEQAMIGVSEAVNLDTPEHEVAALFEKRSLISVAVVDSDGKLCGRITVDDVVHLIRQEGEQALLKSAGLAQEEDLFSPVVASAKRRGVWLGINLVTVFIAVWVIGLFEAALEQIVALAVLMPVAASMGGIAGSQTLTLTIRGQALDQISRTNTPWLIRKELAIGALNGVVWSFFVALISYGWFQDFYLSSIIAAALLVNLLVAALAGVVIPVTLKKLSIDPALSGAVILTTVTDVIGFISFLGMASFFLIAS